ncbi:type VI secretion system-associated protein TagF [Arenibaculum pallidiluteum]|uniref:type VI secretion system-associated protein TagF n=1 Tax=Arenibaculum pallidiluteum TaxID=2812559 RepID=UPI001A961FE2|nr:type VI secretion system-associated protein TagF [Arenibaculum pallidiluteum]
MPTVPVTFPPGLRPPDGAGFHGKMPLLGDFVARGLPPDLVEAWDGWIGPLLVEASGLVGPGWPDAFADAPVWRFALGPGLLTDGAIGGLLIPSVDRVGRQFPLAVICPAEPGPDPEAGSGPDPSPDGPEGWFGRAEAAVLAALDAGAGPDEVLVALAALSRPAPPPLPVAAEGWQAPPPGFAPERGLIPAAGWSAWWRVGCERILCRRGMPVGPELADLVRGRPREGGMRWSSAAASHAGTVRGVNEDAFLERPDLGLWAVADGLGGLDAGDVASRLTMERLGALEPQRSAQAFLAEVTRLLRDADACLRGAAGEGRTMATTAVVLLAFGRHFACLWAGDSRLYRLRGGRLEQLSRDHSEVQDMVDEGILAAAEAASHPRSNVVTRALGAGEDLMLDVIQGAVAPGDRFLLCSDGLTKALAPEAILALAAELPVAEVPGRLVAAALEAGAPDNVTVILAEAGPELAPGPERESEPA